MNSTAWVGRSIGHSGLCLRGRGLPVAHHLRHLWLLGVLPGRHSGRGTCWVLIGRGRVGRSKVAGGGYRRHSRLCRIASDLRSISSNHGSLGCLGTVTGGSRHGNACRCLLHATVSTRIRHTVGCLTGLSDRTIRDGAWHCVARIACSRCDLDPRLLLLLLVACVRCSIGGSLLLTLGGLQLLLVRLCVV